VLRACGGALAMGLIVHVGSRQPCSASTRPSWPGSRRRPTTAASSGRAGSRPAEIDLNVRALSMGKLHHAMMGTAAVAIATAAAIPGTSGQPRAAGARRARQRGLWSSLRHAQGRRGRDAGKRGLAGREGQHVTQRAGADGGLGAGSRLALKKGRRRGRPLIARGAFAPELWIIY
jgi:hypothetical protein